MKFFDRVKELRSDLKSRADARRQRVAADLSILIANAGLKRKEVAQRLEITEAALSIRLNGATNLTLDSIGGICDAAGYEFDVHFRRLNEAPALSFWEMDEALMPPASAPADKKTEKKEVYGKAWLDPSTIRRVSSFTYDVENYHPTSAANEPMCMNHESQRAAA